MPNKENNVFVSSSRNIPEHPAGKAYIEKCNAEAAKLSKEEMLIIGNRLRDKGGLPPRTMDEFLKEFYP